MVQVIHVITQRNTVTGTYMHIKYLYDHDVMNRVLKNWRVSSSLAQCIGINPYGCCYGSLHIQQKTPSLAYNAASRAFSQVYWLSLGVKHTRVCHVFWQNYVIAYACASYTLDILIHITHFCRWKGSYCEGTERFKGTPPARSSNELLSHYGAFSTWVAGFGVAEACRPIQDKRSSQKELACLVEGCVALQTWILRGWIWIARACFFPRGSGIWSALCMVIFPKGVCQFAFFYFLNIFA